MVTVIVTNVIMGYTDVVGYIDCNYTLFRINIMNAMTSQQKTQKHRLRKDAKLFSIYYLDEKCFVTTESFIDAKATDFCHIYNVEKVEFKREMLNYFQKILDNLKLSPSIDGKKYFGIDVLFMAWMTAENKDVSKKEGLIEMIKAMHEVDRAVKMQEQIEKETGRKVETME